MRGLKIIGIVLLFCVLTLLTQIGGIVYLLSLITYQLTDKWTNNRLLQSTYRFASFFVLYSLTTLLIVPVIAKPFGRVPLPYTENNHLKPLNILTCFLNRNYVRPELKQIAFEVSKQMNEKYPGTTVNYLEANFPLINRYPLFPHLSHNDCKKLDFSFCYRDADTHGYTNESPSFIGYGVCEGPQPGEEDVPALCAKKGYWQYNLMSEIVSQRRKQDFIFDGKKTKDLINLFVANPQIAKIFIEPHLKTRLDLNSGKIRFHGYQAVRHDDHFHIQL